jgi:hypothetical protein
MECGVLYGKKVEEVVYGYRHRKDNYAWMHEWQNNRDPLTFKSEAEARLFIANISPMYHITIVPMDELKLLIAERKLRESA